MELAVQAAELLDQGVGVLPVVGGVRRVGGGEFGADAGRDSGVPGRVEPQVRIAGGVGVAVAVVGVVGVVVQVVVDERCGGGGVDHVPGTGLCDGLVDGGLQALEIEDGVGLLDRADLPGRQLQVVRLDAGRGELGHL